MKFIPSIQQQAFFDEVKNGTRSIILEAKAGAGKTKSITESCALVPELRVAALAYNSKIAKELTERTSHLSNVRAMTCHSAGMNALRGTFPGLGKPDGDKMKLVAEQYCRQAGRLDLEPIAPMAAKTASMAKQVGIGVAGLESTLPNWRTMVDHHDLADDMPGMDEAQDDGDDEWIEAQIKKLIGFSMHLLKLSNDAIGTQRWYDFDDMIYVPLKMDLRFFKNDIVFLDEAQDTNRTRRLLARRMVKPNGKLIAVGDRNQAIYGFSGADNDSLDQIANETGAIRMPLSVTYRCPKAVVAVAQQWVPDITAHEGAAEGTFMELPYAEIVGHLLPGDAVLCRFNKYLVGLCFRLLRNNKPARIEGRDIGKGLIALARKWKTDDTSKLSQNVIAWRDREAGKAEQEGKDSKAEQIRDKAETLLVMIERCLEEGIRSVKGLVAKIASMFEDNVADSKGMITLCSVHRSKGLEWPRVYILGLYELMGRVCKQDWQTQQEINLQYVGATRALEVLVNVTGVREEPKQHSQEQE